MEDESSKHPALPIASIFFDERKNELRLHDGVVLTHRMQRAFELAHTTAKMVSKKLSDARYMAVAIG